MSNVENLIKNLKSQPRENFIFLRRRIDKGNGKKTLGWIVKKENSENYIENLDFNMLNSLKENL